MVAFMTFRPRRISGFPLVSASHGLTQVYHVINRGVGKKDLFFSDDDYRVVTKRHPECPFTGFVQIQSARRERPVNGP